MQRLLDSWQQQRAQQEANAADCREAVAVATQQKRYEVGQASCSIDYFPGKAVYISAQIAGHSSYMVCRRTAEHLPKEAAA